MRRVLWTGILPLLLLLVGAAGAQGADGNNVVEMEFDGARLADVLRVLGELGGYNVIVDASVQDQVSFRLRDMTVDEALAMVIRTGGYSSRRIGNTLIVGHEETLRARFDRRESRVIPVRYADPAALVPVLQLLVPSVQAQADVAQRALIVRGTPEELAQAAQLVGERDVRPLVNEEFVETPVVDILRALARLGGYNLLVQGDIGGRMTVVFERQQAADAVDLVARRAGLVYEIDGSDLIVTAPTVATDGETPAASALQVEERRIFQLVHIPPAQIIDAVRVLVGTGEVWADEASRMLIVSAGAAASRQVEELVARLDVPTLTVRGVLRQDDEFVGILEVDGVSYIVRADETVGSVTVLAVDADGVLVETVHGRRLRVPAGG